MASVPVRIRLRNDGAANWASVNPILAAGEPGFETDTGRLRIGDGVNPFSALPYYVLSGEFSPNAYLSMDQVAYSGSLGSVTGRKIFQVSGTASGGWAGLAAGDVVLHWDIDGSNAIQFGLQKSSSVFGMWHRAKIAAAWGGWRRAVDSAANEVVAGNKTFSGNTVLSGQTQIAQLLSSVLIGGYTSTAVDDGTKSSGTYLPDPLAVSPGNLRRFVNGGAFTLAAPTRVGDYSMILEMTNNASAGLVSTSGFLRVTGDPLTTTNGHKFQMFIVKTPAGSTLNVMALQ
ncbi:MAG: hypothetical protein LCH61_01215 [Proteobacteria bacterium]|nr:hypothetical protein [Pseudomonadota bacterium]